MSDWDKIEHLKKYCRKKMDSVHMRHNLAREFISKGKWPAALDALDEEKSKLRNQMAMIDTLKIAINQTVGEEEE